MSVRDLEDYLRHIQNNMHPSFINNIAKEMQEKDKEIERLKEELKYSISIVEHNKTIQSNINSYNKLAKYSNELEDRIDKAIDYVNANTLPNDEDYMFCMMLLDILKGSDKE